MADEWLVHRVEDIAAAMGDAPFGSLLKNDDYTDEGALVVQGKNIQGRTCDWSDRRYVSHAKYESLRRSHCLIGDLLFPKVGTIGKVGILTACPDVREYILSTNTMRFRADEAVATADYVYYFFTWSETVNLIHALNSKSVQPVFNFTSLKNFRITLPPLAEQKAIAHILGTLDDKIELNRRTNETLEAMARGLFKSWFVDFDPVHAKARGCDTGLPKPLADLFPDSFVDSELGEIPRGWSVASLSDVCTVIDCLHSKKPERKESGRPLLQLSNIRDNGLIDMADTYFIDEAAYDQWISRMEASEGDCVVTNVGRVGAVAQIPTGFKAALGRNMTGVRCKATFPFPTFIIENLLSEAMRGEMSLKTDSGTILDALNVRNIPRLRFMRASPQVLQRFEQLTRPLRARMEEGLAQSWTLAALRDMLLPKLISGELRINADGPYVAKATR